MQKQNGREIEQEAENAELDEGEPHVEFNIKLSRKKLKFEAILHAHYVYRSGRDEPICSNKSFRIRHTAEF